MVQVPIAGIIIRIKRLLAKAQVTDHCALGGAKSTTRSGYPYLRILHQKRQVTSEKNSKGRRRSSYKGNIAMKRKVMRWRLVTFMQVEYIASFPPALKAGIHQGKSRPATLSGFWYSSIPTNKLNQRSLRNQFNVMSSTRLQISMKRDTKNPCHYDNCTHHKKCAQLKRREESLKFRRKSIQ